MSVTGWPFAYQHTSCTVTTFGLAHCESIRWVSRVLDQHTSFWVNIRHKIKLSSLFHLLQLKISRSTKVIPSKAKKDDKVPTHRPFSRLCLCLGRRMLPRLLHGWILLHGQFGLKCDHHHYSRRIYCMHLVDHLSHRMGRDGWRHDDYLLQFRVQIQ